MVGDDENDEVNEIFRERVQYIFCGFCLEDSSSINLKCDTTSPFTIHLLKSLTIQNTRTPSNTFIMRGSRHIIIRMRRHAHNEALRHKDTFTLSIFTIPMQFQLQYLIFSRQYVIQEVRCCKKSTPRSKVTISCRGK